MPPRTGGADAPPLDRAVARQAATWIVRLGENPRPEDLAACARWRAADPEHERAWQRVQRLGEKFGALPAGLGMSALGRAQRDGRRAALKTLAAAATIVPAGYLGHRLLPWDAWMADARTATGERRTVALADGTRIDMNTASAIDIRFDANERRVVLVAGEILVETGRDANNPSAHYRPFIVQTPQGRMRALGTRFVVRKDGERDATELSVLHSAVEVTPVSAPSRRRVIASGEQVRFFADAIDATGPADAHVADWTRGVLFADAMRVDRFAAELNRYRPGLLRCDPAVAGLTITGAFQLDNTDTILAALPLTLPVRVLARTRYWVTIAPADTLDAPHSPGSSDSRQPHA